MVIELNFDPAAIGAETQRIRGEQLSGLQKFAQGAESFAGRLGQERGRLLAAQSAATEQGIRDARKLAGRGLSAAIAGGGASTGARLAAAKGASERFSEQAARLRTQGALQQAQLGFDTMGQVQQAQADAAAARQQALGFEAETADKQKATQKTLAAARVSAQEFITQSQNPFELDRTIKKKIAMEFVRRSQLATTAEEKKFWQAASQKVQQDDFEIGGLFSSTGTL